LKSESLPNHLLHPGARVYTGHTGSSWDEPAKALKAGAHGVPGGENIVVSGDGRVRYFTIREMARLQGMPDKFEIDETWQTSIKQLGNAVPVEVGYVFGKAIREQICLP
jgi:DNA (cytosine-5)-methyltransferase 1